MMRLLLHALAVVMFVTGIADATTTPASFLLRRDTKANWTSANPTLGSGEQGYEQPALGKPARVKIGDGATGWNLLKYFGTPPTIVYASQAGCKLDSNIKTGGGTDDTAAMQALLDTAPSVGVLEVVVDGPALVTGLKVSSNTRLRFLPGAGLYLKTGSHKAMISNKNPVAPGGTRVDHDIEIVGGFFNGNGANQNDSDSIGASGTYTNGMNFDGVTQLTLRGVHMYDSRVWGVSARYCSYVAFYDYQHEIVPGSTRISQDGIDVRGPCDHVVIRGGRFNVYDDAIALNAKDSQGLVGVYGGPYAGNGGAITDVTISDVTMENALFGIDIISESQRIDRISIDGVHGTVQNNFIALSNYPFGPYAAPVAKGNIGTVTVSNIDCVATGTPFLGGNDGTYNLFENIRLQANVEHLSISNFKTRVTVDYRPQIHLLPCALAGGYQIGTLEINNLGITDTAIGGTVAYPRISLEGVVDRLIINGASWYRSAAFARGGDLVGLLSYGVGSTLSMSGITVNRASSLANQGSGTTLPAMTLVGSRLDDSATGYLLSVASASTALVTAGNKTNGAEVGGANAGGVTVTH